MAMRRLQVVLAAFVLSVVSVASVRGDFTRDDFNGPSGQWTTGSFPTVGWTSTDYVGAPTMTYGSEGSTAFVTMSSAPGTYSRAAVRSVESITVVPGEAFTLEARARSGAPLDHFVELWLLNSSDPNQYVFICFAAANLGADRGMWWASSLDGSYHTWNGVPWTTDTWYKLRISQPAVGNAEVSLVSDDGASVLYSHSFTHDLSQVGSTFYVGLGQAEGATSQPMTADVDYVAVPEPTTIGLLSFGGLLLLLRRK
jgi:hypothetical protein